ncbi:MAG: hypothetical protein K6B28_12270 [Lachnospiraceae bacterium]|nr:hypothetical protein [Lachnospiraceae bacterium]
MIFLLAFILFTVFSVLSLIAGYVIFIRTKHMDESLVTLYAQGMSAIVLIFCVLNTVCSLLGANIKFTGALWLSVIFFLELVFIFRDTRLFPVFVKEIKNELKKSFEQPVITYIFGAVIFLLMVLQIVFATGHVSSSYSVFKGVSYATMAYENGNIEVSHPMMMLYAWLSVLLRVHPLTMIFSILPFVMIPVYYAFEWSLSGKLFGNDKNIRLLMMLFFNIIQIWGFFDEKVMFLNVIMSYYRGSTFFVYAILPMILWFILDHLEKKKEADGDLDTETTFDEDEEELDMKNHRIVNARTVGIVLIISVILFAAAVYILNKKINSLYDATVALETRMGEGIDIKEFDDGSNTCYVIIKKDGMDVYGGSGEEKREELLDYLKGFDKKIDTWYLTKGSKEDKASYEYCKDKGLKVDRALYIDLEEYTE